MASGTWDNGASGNGSWSLDESTGVLTISGTGAMCVYYLDDPPWHEYDDSITKVVFESGITHIQGGFDVKLALKSVVIGDTVTSITYNAFQWSSNITSIIFQGDTAPTMSTGSFSLGSSSDNLATATVYTKGGWGSDDVFSSVKGSFTTFIYKDLGATNVNVNDDGAWKNSIPHVNVNGSWKNVSKTWINVNGTWKEGI